jgi:menaquinone-specific isochorismate synthase
LPFDPSEPAHLLVPRRVYGSYGGTSWITEVEGQPEPEQLPWGAEGGNDPLEEQEKVAPDEFLLRSAMSQSDWKAAVRDALEAIGSKELRKVVLARRVDIWANRPFVVTEVLERLASLYPSCTVFNVEGFLGASPELLLRKAGDRIESHPLAGTVARSGDQAGDEALVASLLGSAKARFEHQVVVEAIGAALGPCCEELDLPASPSVVGLRNVSHLATRITGRLRPDRACGALEMVARLHPTPAVGGDPTRPALALLAKLEGFDRGRYAGPVGWVDSRGDGVFVLGIRCAEVEGHCARIFAGNGIVAGSDPAAELTETQLKLQALLAALVRP